jgi:hypothetical protein
MKTIKALFPVYWQLVSSREGIILITGILAVVFYDTFYLQLVRIFPNYSMQLFLLTGILWLFVFPSLVNCFFMKIPYHELGGSIGSIRNWGKWLLFLLALGIGWAYIVSRNPSYRSFYPMFPAARTSIVQFVYYQCMVALYMYSWEYFCRGFLLFGLKTKWGRYAILIQLIIFTLLHQGKPEYLVSIIGGLGMGIFAYEAGTFLPVFLLHFITALFLDIFCLI